MGTTALKFSDIYDEFHEKLHRYLERMNGKNNAEDLTQEVLLRINKGLKDFKGRSSLSTWVYRIATNVALDRMKSRSFRQDNETVALEGTDADPDAGHICIDEKSLSAEREAIRNEMNECIREYVDKLPADYRTVVILSEIKDLKNQEIADILGISLDTVKIRLHRARVRLRAEFEAGCDFYHDENGNLACDRKKSEKDGE
ncbi:MAG: RNA polymerase sigma factor [Phycisphaerales bacterium]|nr:MAG: RNA polymerase sigma factor [Phycisphaerales bacterium]